MRKIALFNNKGGVGKTTLTVNIAAALGDAGLRVLLIDADPQCNLTSFYLEEQQVERLLGESDDDESGSTLWSGIKPVVRGRGGPEEIPLLPTTHRNVTLAPGDVLLADYEEELPEAWTGSFARRERGYDVLRALSDVVALLAARSNADVVLYDVGPNVGPLNRIVLLDSDFFITPVAADLFSLRALSTVGRAVSRWISDYRTIRMLAEQNQYRGRLLPGMPVYLGYITSAFKVNVGRRASNPHEHWEARIAPRVTSRVVNVLRNIDPALVTAGGNKVGGVKHFQSLAPSAQEHGVAIGELRGLVNSGNNATIDEARSQFATLAAAIRTRAGI